MISKLVLLSAVMIGTFTLNAAEPIHANFGYVLQGQSAINIHDIQLGYEFVGQRFAKNYNADIKFIFYPLANTAIESFTHNEIQYLGLVPSTFAHNISKLQPYIGDIFLSSSTDTLLEKYVVLINNEDTLSLKSLQGKQVAMQEKDSNAQIYADMLCINQFHKRYFDALHVKQISSADRAILMVFFNQADGAIVPERTWELAKTLNPAINKKVKLLASSPVAFFAGIEIYRNDLSPEQFRIARQSNADLTVSEDGKQLLRIMKVKKHVLINKRELESYLIYYLRYETILTQFEKSAR